MRLVDWIMRKKRAYVAIDPTEILVGLICAQIIRHPRTTWSCFVQGYYDTHVWQWPGKEVRLQYDTASYAWDSLPHTVDLLKVAGEVIELSLDQKNLLVAALIKSHEHAVAIEEAATLAGRQLKACDAIERIMK